MIYSTYIYIVLSCFAIFSLVYIFYNLKLNKSHIDNKILLKDLLENFDLDLPEELKGLENTSTDPQKLS